MSNKKEALGKGIRALLESIDTDVNTEAVNSSVEKTNTGNSTSSIPLELIEINPFQPRANFENSALQELANSIKIHGVIQPITLRRISAKKFQLISGERRLRAAKMAGLKEIPSYIRTANDQEMLEMALIENIQRENLNPIEIAINYKRLIDECDLTQEEMAERISKDRATVANYLRLLKLPPEIQMSLKGKEISMAHARAIINVADPALQLMIYKDIMKKGLSVRQVESMVREIQNLGVAKTKSKSKESLPFQYQKVQDKLRSHFSTGVKLKRGRNGRGEIVISYFSDDDLNRILEIIDNSH